MGLVLLFVGLGIWAVQPPARHAGTLGSIQGQARRRIARRGDAEQHFGPRHRAHLSRPNHARPSPLKRRLVFVSSWKVT